jgi:hypothetical protein
MIFPRQSLLLHRINWPSSGPLTLEFQDATPELLWSLFDDCPAKTANFGWLSKLRMIRSGSGYTVQCVLVEGAESKLERLLGCVNREAVEVFLEAFSEPLSHIINPSGIRAAPIVNVNDPNEVLFGGDGLNSAASGIPI